MAGLVSLSQFINFPIVMGCTPVKCKRSCSVNALYPVCMHACMHYGWDIRNVQVIRSSTSTKLRDSF